MSAITNITLTTYSGGGAAASVNYNSLKSINLYGALNVYDNTGNGSTIQGIIKTPRLTINGNDINNVIYTGIIRASTSIFINNVNVNTTFKTNQLLLNNVDVNTSFSSTTINTNQINYNYSTIPTLNSTNLGYINTLNYTGITAISANAFVNLSASLPVGVYLINAYAYFQVSTINLNARIGMNTIINTLNTAYNYTQNYVATTFLQSISYNYILRNTSTTTYYFYFNSGSASTLTSFNVNILRIA